MTSFTLTGGDMDEEEAAAAMAAVACLLEAEGAATAPPDDRRAGWRDAARLIAQGLIPTRTPAPPRWGNIERLRRAGRGGGGIVGQ
ncbi:MAG TPA: hypothetical protein PKD53_01190 [Chloroflexaceae bacterium]|nr:hypothetical protein [Chloroflexaceae bacterium]